MLESIQSAFLSGMAAGAIVVCAFVEIGWGDVIRRKSAHRRAMERLQSYGSDREKR